MLGLKKKDFIVVDHEVSVVEAKSGRTAVFKRKDDADAVRDHLRKEIKKDKNQIRTIPFIH